jgi:predicted SAM-dependent methyltransferase
MKLNIGATAFKGRYTRSEWVNMDLHAHAPGIMRGDARQIPFRDNAFDEVHLIHVLEHLGRWDHQKVLDEIYRVLMPGCWFFVEVPHWAEGCKLAWEAYQRQDWGRVHDWNTGMYGKQRFRGDFHQSGFWPEKLAFLLRTAGFTDIKWFVDEEDMISGHYRAEPVILMRGTK